LESLDFWGGSKQDLEWQNCQNKLCWDFAMLSPAMPIQEKSQKIKNKKITNLGKKT
jgi:hypothetical protein